MCIRDSSPLINCGLLDPRYVLKESLSFSKKNNIPLNSVEGFIRQIIGWREFIRGVYYSKGSEERSKNFWGFKRKIPNSFYDGTTGIEPVDDDGDSEDWDEDGIGDACDYCNDVANVPGNVNVDASGEEVEPIINVMDILAFSDLLDDNSLINDCQSLDLLEDGEINQFDLIVLIDLVAGGGIDSLEDFRNYADIGADHVSVGTVCFNALKLRKLV